MTIENTIRTRILHRDFNLGRHHNLDELPDLAAVFAIVAIVNGKPANCRYVGKTTNLQLSLADVFENPDSGGLRKFMQGPWLKELHYEIVSTSGHDDIDQIVQSWIERYNPKVDDAGDYPGYYDYSI